MNSRPKKTNMPKALKITSIICGALLGLFLVFIATLPSILSTNWGKKTLISVIEKNQNISISIDELNLSLFGNQEAKLVSISDKGGDWNLISQDIKVDSGFIPLIFTGLNGKEIALTQPNLEVRTTRWSPEEIEATSQRHKTKRLNTALKIDQGSVDIYGEGFDTIRFENINAALTLDSKRDIDIDISALTHQNGLRGSLKANGSVVFKRNMPTADISASFDNLPIVGVDQILSLFNPSLQGLLTGMIGNSCNLNLTAQTSPEKINADFNIISPKFSGSFATTTSDQVVSLSQPGRVRFPLSPELIRLQYVQKHLPVQLELLNTPYVEINLDELEIPRNKQTFDWQHIRLSSALALQNANLSILGKAPLENLTLSGNIFSSDIAEQTSFSTTGSFSYQEHPASFQTQGTLKALLSDSRSGVIAFDGKDLPLTFIAKNADQAQMVSNTIGDRVNTSLDLTIDKESRILLSANSNRLKFSELNLRKNNTIELLSPARFTLSPVIPNAAITPIDGELQSFSLPSNLDFEELKLNADLYTREISIDPIDAFTFPSLQQVSSKLIVDSIDAVHFDLQSADFNAKIYGKLVNNQVWRFNLTKPLSLSYQLTQAELSRFLPSNLQMLQLTQPTPITLKVESISIPFSNNLLPYLEASVSAESSKISMISLDNGASIDLENLKASTQFSGKKGRLEASLSSNAQSFQHSGNLAIDVIVTNCFSPTRDILIDSKFNELPTELFQSFLGGKYSLADLIGNQLSGKIELVTNSHDHELLLDLNSDHLRCDLDLQLNDQLIKLKKGKKGYLQLQITQDSRLLLREMIKNRRDIPRFELDKPSIFSFSINELTFPLADPASAHYPWKPRNWEQLALNFSGKINNLTFNDRFSKQVSFLDHGSLIGEKKQGDNPLDLSIKGAIGANYSEKKGSKTGSIRADMTIDNPLGDTSLINYDNLAYHLTIEANQLPSLMLDALIGTIGEVQLPFSALFGSEINCELKSDMKQSNGTITADLFSTNSRASLNGWIDHGTLRLLDPLHMQLKMTEELSSFFFKESDNPNTLISSKNPIVLNVDSQGFYIPILPYNPQGIGISHGRLELGQIICRNAPTLELFLNLLKIHNVKGNTPIWFSPLDFNVQKGYLNCERTEILVANSLQIATWGGVDLPTESVRMVLGLTAQSLNEAFSILNVPPKYVLQIPMEGKIGDVRINTGVAAAKIGQLLLWQNRALTESLREGQGGQIFGGIYDIFARLPDANTPAPDPKHPFPWELSSYFSSSLPSQEQVKEKVYKNNPENKLIKLLIIK